MPVTTTANKTFETCLRYCSSFQFDDLAELLSKQNSYLNSRLRKAYFCCKIFSSENVRIWCFIKRFFQFFQLIRTECRSITRLFLLCVAAVSSGLIFRWSRDANFHFVLAVAFAVLTNTLKISFQFALRFPVANLVDYN